MTHRRSQVALIAAGTAALVLCMTVVPPARLAHAQTADQTGPARRPTGFPGASAGPPIAPPHPLADVASIVEADVAKLTTMFDNRLGPRLVVELSNVVVHAGSPLPEPTFSQLGGPLPGGGYLEVHELPKFSVGSRYIIFLSKQASLYTPVWARLAFRVEQLSTRAIVLGPDGQLVLHIGLDGVRFGTTKLIADVDHFKPQAARVFNRAVAESDADLALAVSPQDFVAAARQAASAVGAPFGAAISIKPPANVRWDITSTSPQ